MSGPLSRGPPLVNQASSIPLVAFPSPELLRQQGERAYGAERLAHEISDVCEHAEQHLQFAVRARQDQQVAWMVLCERGWPLDASADGVNFPLIAQFLRAWGDLVALPVRMWKPTDLLKMTQVRKRLAQTEQQLRTVLPAALWEVVDPLDDTGRATLAYVLQALDVWHDANTRCLAAARIKEALIQRFGEFAAQADALALTAPDAPLDLDGWRALAADARLLAEQDRRRRRNEVPSGEFPTIS